MGMLKHPCRPTVDDEDAMGIPVVRRWTMEMLGIPVVRRWTTEISSGIPVVRRWTTVMQR
jgi:hypothetical protein